MALSQRGPGAAPGHPWHCSHWVPPPAPAWGGDEAGRGFLEIPVPQLLHIGAGQQEGLWQAGELGPGVPSAVRNRAVGWKEQKEQGQASASLGKLLPSGIKEHEFA